MSIRYKELRYKKWLLCLFVSQLSIVGFGQDYVIPFRDGSQWGYANEKGELLVDAKYDSVSIKNDHNRWQVYKAGKINVLNETGKEIFPQFVDGLKRDPKHSAYHDYYVQVDSLFGYADMNGQFILPPKYTFLFQCAYPDNLPYDQAYNFFVGDGEKYKIIDRHETVLLRDIVNVDALWEGLYFMKVKNKADQNLWGVYNVANHRWLLPPILDTMELAPYRENYSEMDQIRWVVKKGDESFIMDHNWQLYVCDEQCLDSVYTAPEFSYLDDDFDMVADMVPMPGWGEQEYVDIRALKNFNAASPHQEISMASIVSIGDFETVSLIEKSKGIGLNIRYKTRSYKGSFNYEDVMIPAEYDSIKLLVSEREYVLNTYFLVSKNGKWGVYGLLEKELVVPVVYDTISLSFLHEILLLEKNNQIGIFYMAEYNEHDRYQLLVEPEFDDFVSRGHVKTTERGNYTTKDIYYFYKKGKLCLVSQDGVKFYMD
jgi:hypothetical protein